MASINLREGSELKLGGTVRFICDVPKNVSNARIEILGYDVESGEFIYGEAISADDEVNLTLRGQYGVVLGGAPGSGSIWARRGGPAHCIVNLFYFGQHAGHQTYNKLASLTFEAEG